MVERRVSATEARVHFGEVMDGVTRRNDIVFVERAGAPAVVIVSLEEWERHGRREDDPWAGVAEEMEAHWAHFEKKYGSSLNSEAVEEILRLAKEDRDARPF